MKMRTKSALVVTIGLALLFYVVFAFDYTDHYVGDRFLEAVRTAPEDSAGSFSLDAFMEYYDWDHVCVVLPGSEREFKTILGRPYRLQAANDRTWSLVLLKNDAVNAEIPVDSSILLPPAMPDNQCIDRWSAIFALERDGTGRLHLTYSGH
ncbi:hypothetical protein [Pseudodesulfovibrio indicus]|uniref:Uncharacterized protein n=1 Tax=Pseudodesulfovibrio indicus TaxID=1716143 RepID=A0A126QKK5_9BACT|nr:hypothetical protein [Pseudodesulfovibrio indicus]AMK10326.1 hypothetical protein AWY79_03930 [Pseudodesulfovibrio indicus]TDT81942.1 hypothetical protein EDC59_12016 [Pseudodesulfovibrio indicus]